LHIELTRQLGQDCIFCGLDLYVVRGPGEFFSDNRE
jgi:hypothetical protein